MEGEILFRRLRLVAWSLENDSGDQRIQCSRTGHGPQSLLRRVESGDIPSGLGVPGCLLCVDDVASRPELCITLLRILLSRYGTVQALSPLDRADKEIILLAYQLARPIRPKDVEVHLDLNSRTAVRYLKSLCSKGWFQPIASAKGIKTMQYRLEQRNLDDFGW